MTSFRSITAGLFALAFLTGCEGWNRTTDPSIDLHEQPDSVHQRVALRDSSIADELEKMMELRQAYLEHLKSMEQRFLDRGDLPRANWARRQRLLTAAVEIYPYADDTVPEQTEVEVKPIASVPEANRMYDEAMALLNRFYGIPLAGALPSNQDIARQSMELMREMIQTYPTSDKVDDAAFWIGEIYKEYLREDDPDNALALRYYRWAWELNPSTPHPARFQSAVVHDFRMHDRLKALELYHQVVELNEHGHPTNRSFSLERIRQLTDDENSPVRPREPQVNPHPRNSNRLAGEDASGINDDPDLRSSRP